MYILNIIICNPSYINDYTLWGENTFEQESFSKRVDQWSSLNEEILVWSENIKGPIMYLCKWLGHLYFLIRLVFLRLKMIIDQPFLKMTPAQTYSLLKGVVVCVRRRRQLNFFQIRIYLPIYIFFFPLPMYGFQLDAYWQYIEVWRRGLGGYEWIEWL